MAVNPEFIDEYSHPLIMASVVSVCTGAIVAVILYFMLQDCTTFETPVYGFTDDHGSVHSLCVWLTEVPRSCRHVHGQNSRGNPWSAGLLCEACQGLHATVPEEGLRHSAAAGPHTAAGLLHLTTLNALRETLRLLRALAIQRVMV